MTRRSVPNADGENGSRHRGPAVPDDEKTLGEAARTFFTAHNNRIYLFMVVMLVIVLCFAVNAVSKGSSLAGFGAAVGGVVAFVLFVLDGAELHYVQRRPWLKWTLRSWWAVFVVALAAALLT